MSSERILVVGGGAAGLMAAGRAAEAGADVVVLEKMKRPGRKISISGKGRCNITNIADLNDFISHFGRNGRFLHQAFHRFFSDDLMQFFENRGLELVTERGGRVFPARGRAVDVVTALLAWLDDLQVSLRPDSPVDRLMVQDNQICGVGCGNNIVQGRAVILATGGASYPATGSTGDGYTLAASVGHSIVPIRPALVPVVTKGNMAARLSGLHLRNTAVRLFIDGKKKKDAFGELLFMKYGLSGPVILSLSGMIADALEQGRKVALVLDVKPALDERKLDKRLLRDFSKRHNETMDSILRGLMPREMVPVCLHKTGIRADRLGGEVRAVERKRLLYWLKNIEFPVTGVRGLKEAIVTAGGVDLREVDPRTMQSRLCKGLFLAGELLDLQADTGGYNLQAAFSTGWVAGVCAAALLRDGFS
jgi:predicted Rossmann fold flavoprotein